MLIFNRVATSPIVSTSTDSSLDWAGACGQVKAIRLHDCRHTHATLLLEAGEAMDYVADRLGDRLGVRLDTVARVCAHVPRSRREGGVARWAALKQAQTVALAATGDYKTR